MSPETMAPPAADAGADHGAILQVLQCYFDGLYHADTARLGRVFHPRAIYATARGAALQLLSMDEYFPIVDARVAPAARGDARQDRIVSIELAGPETAVAIVECALLPRRFRDVLTLVRVDGRWQILSKVFHFDEA